MTYTITYEESVVKNDIPRLNSHKNVIQRAIERKLSKTPELFGERLRGDLKGYWKLRVGAYRIIFRIQGSTVHIFKIDHRSKVYKLLFKLLFGDLI